MNKSVLIFYVPAQATPTEIKYDSHIMLAI